jgi:hypothetical protein
LHTPRDIPAGSSQEFLMKTVSILNIAAAAIGLVAFSGTISAWG